MTTTSNTAMHQHHRLSTIFCRALLLLLFIPSSSLLAVAYNGVHDNVSPLLRGKHNTETRRSLLGSSMLALGGMHTARFLPFRTLAVGAPANAEDSNNNYSNNNYSNNNYSNNNNVGVGVGAEESELYFGVGCYWHIQHEFVDAERSLLGRTDRQLTARTGYAGGTRLGSEGRVCYHNFQGLADYGKLGHGEVVGLKIPEEKVSDFAKLYFSLFDPETGDRVDPQDKGPEYRSLIGLPGGLNSSMFPVVEEAGSALNFTLSPGKGNEPDTLGSKVVYVYDTAKFPFHQAEVYMQFRDDFQSPPYGKPYNKLVELALEDGRVVGQGCPDTY